MRSTGSPSAESDRLRERIETLGALLDLREHDLDRLFERDAQFRRRLLALLDGGKIAYARALVRWGLR